MKKKLKEQLYLLCMDYVEKRISNLQGAILVAKESANDDSKSSAGDKHETGRAMAQLEQEKSGYQLKEAQELKNNLEKININTVSKSVQLGSIVITDKGNFFVSIPVGKLILDSQTYYAISLSSPIGVKVKNLTKKDAFEMNNIVYKILEIL